MASGAAHILTISRDAMNSERYAVYFAPPPSSALWKFGSRLLGRDAYSGNKIALHVPAGVSAQEYADLVSGPGKYGFHATLKAPFSLHPDTQVSELIVALEKLARMHNRILIPRLIVAVLKDFIAIRPKVGSRAIDDLAANCVTQLDHFRAPLSLEQIRKRRMQALSNEQDELMLRWGYPYVLDQYRFHMTLTGRLENKLLSVMHQVLARELEHVLRQEYVVDALTLFRQEAPDQPFQAVMRFPLAGGIQDAFHE